MPNVRRQQNLQDWKYLKDPDVFAIACDHDKVENTLQEIVKFAKNTNSLVILDDCAASQSVKNRTSELVKLAFHGRHIGLSTIVITQQLTSIAKPYRMKHIEAHDLLQCPQGRQERRVRKPSERR